MYLLDANVLIDAKNRYYAFDITPGFWDWLARVHSANQVASIEAVRAELLHGDDELARWAEEHPSFFRELDDATVRRFRPLATWASEQGFSPSALAAFTGDQADFQLIAFACEHQHIVVTLERSHPQARKRVMIPDACAAMNVMTIDPFEMLRHTGACFDLRVPTDGGQFRAR